MKTKHSSVDSYIDSFPKHIQDYLHEMRIIIKSVIPEAEEIISYNMPAYKTKTVLVYFAGYAKHIGFYPTATGINYIKEELQGFTYSKGAIQFPLDKPLPVDLIMKIVEFRKQYSKP